jgi:hypothetical protein
MPKKKADSAYDVKMSDTERTNLAHDLCREIQDALNARSAITADGGMIDLIDWFYEQGRSNPEDRPFAGAADLTSYIITENVDAYRSQLTDAVFSGEPFCVVEGWGADAAKAPFVEAFHDWQVEEEGLDEELSKVVHGALIEDGHILEVRERIETRRITEEIDVALELHEEGGPIIGQDLQPKLMMDEYGEPVPAQEGQPSARVKRVYTKTKRLGPEYDVISMKDFVFLPGHARNKRQVWGYAYRFWERIPELQEKVEDKIYDKDAVAMLGTQSNREQVTSPAVVMEIAPQEGPSVEKELFSLSLKRDLDGDGREEWYLATISVQHQTLLRLKLDTFVQKVGKSRCVPFVLFPRRDSVYGYSYAGDKLMTLAEEHTALRNMKADRGALATNAPIQQMQGGLWDAEAQPFGVGRVITVRDHNELTQMQVADVPNSIVEQERAIIQAKERVGHLSDTSIGVQASERRTLGENKMVATGSAIRVKETLKNLRRAIRHVMDLRHAIWIETLESDPKGLEAPSGVAEALAASGNELQDGRFTASMLKGKFRFKPYGSVDTADSEGRMQYFTQSMVALSNMAQTIQPMALLFQSPEVAKAILMEWARIYKVRDAQVFIKALTPPMMPMGLPAAGGQAGEQMLPQAQGALPPGPPQGPPDIAQLMQMLQQQGGGRVQ